MRIVFLYLPGEVPVINNTTRDVRVRVMMTTGTKIFSDIITKPDVL